MVKAKWNQDINVPAGKQVGTHRWGVDYAAEVHEGSMSPQGVEKPARPWVGINIDSFDLLVLLWMLTEKLVILAPLLWRCLKLLVKYVKPP